MEGQRNFGLKILSLHFRISVIYRVKSAQKIKLTDRQLSQRLAPILALYIVYLLAWSLAKPSHAIEMKMTGGLRFEECSVDWWDHAILICEYAVHFFTVRVGWGRGMVNLDRWGGFTDTSRKV